MNINMKPENVLAYTEAWFVANSEGNNLARLARMANSAIKAGIIFS